MLTANLNLHEKWKFPKIGDIVGVNIPHPPDHEHRYRKFIVYSFPGIDTNNQFNRRAMAHCVNLKALDNGQLETVAYQWLEPLS